MSRNSIIILSTAMLLATTSTGAFAFGVGGHEATHHAQSSPVTRSQSPDPEAALSKKPGNTQGIHPIKFKPVQMLPDNTAIQGGGPLPGGGSVPNEGQDPSNCAGGLNPVNGGCMP